MMGNPLLRGGVRTPVLTAGGGLMGIVKAIQGVPGGAGLKEGVSKGGRQLPGGHGVTTAGVRKGEPEGAAGSLGRRQVALLQTLAKNRSEGTTGYGLRKREKSDGPQAEKPKFHHGAKKPRVGDKEGSSLQKPPPKPLRHIKEDSDLPGARRDGLQDRVAIALGSRQRQRELDEARAAEDIVTTEMIMKPQKAKMAGRLAAVLDDDALAHAAGRRWSEKESENVGMLEKMLVGATALFEKKSADM